MRLEYSLVSVFAARPFEGASRAVFPCVAGLDSAAMQSVATSLGHAQTVFVTAARRADCMYRLRVFTPRRELPLGVGASLAAAVTLAPASPTCFELGVVAITVARTETPEGAGWSVSLPRTVVGGPLDDRPAVATALGLTPDDLDPAAPVTTATAGLGWLLVPLRDTRALARAWVHPSAWTRVVEKARVVGVLAFTRDGAGSARCRALPVTEGVPEDPATGSACGPLGVFLARHGGLPEATLRCVQGAEDARRSVLHVTVDGRGDGDGAVRVSGCGAVAATAWVEG